MTVTEPRVEQQTFTSLDPATGHVYACANAGPGVGGMTMFDGVRWIGFNNDQYGLGVPWPFPTDNSEAIAFRPSNGSVAVNPMYAPPGPSAASHSLRSPTLWI